MARASTPAGGGGAASPHRLADRVGAGRVAAGGICLLVAVGVGGFLVVAHGAAVETALLGLLGLAWNAGVVGASAMLGESVQPVLRPDVEGIGEATMGIGAVAGGLLAGIVLPHGGLSAVWALTAVLAAGVLPVARRRPR